jgi:secondary thiamine-phosphate synthase enzyme
MASGSHKFASQNPTGEIALSTERRSQLIDVTAAVAKMVRDSGVPNGICHLYVPHTTAGIIVNEHDDPGVATDIEAMLDRLIPKDAGYRHAEGNSDSHIKASLVGTSALVFISEGRLELGRWQGIFFCEFDGPRNRTLRIKIVPG